MKKLALLLAAALTLSFTACGDKAPASSSVPPPSSSSPAAPTDNIEIPAPVLDQKPVTLKQFEEPSGPVATMKTSMGDIEIMLFPEEAPKAVENFITHAKAGYYDNLIFHRVIDNFMIQGGDPKGTGTGGESIWGEAFEDEFSDSLHNFRGALSMANSGPNTNGSQFFIVQTKQLQTQSGTAAEIPDMLYGNLLYNQGMTRISKMAPTFADQSQFDAYIGAEQNALNKLMEADTPADFSKRLEPVMAKYAEVGGTPNLDNKHTVFGQVTKGMDVVDAIAAVEKGEGDKPKEDIKILSITIKE